MAAAAIMAGTCLMNVTNVFAIGPSDARFPKSGDKVYRGYGVASVLSAKGTIYGGATSVVIEKQGDWENDLIVYLFKYNNENGTDSRAAGGGVGSFIELSPSGTGTIGAGHAYQDPLGSDGRYYTEDEVRALFTNLSKEQVENRITRSYCYVMEWRNPSVDGGETEVKYIDYDTFKSEFASEVATASIPGNKNAYFDLKGHAMAKNDAANQMLLAQNFANGLGKKAKEVTTFGIFPRRDLSTSENGAKYVLTWKNLSIKTPGTICAVCYNQTDGAYILTGTVDATGKAVFPDFKLRAATNVTIFILQ